MWKGEVKARKPRYGDYYSKLMEDIYLKEYARYVKRIKKLKKDIDSLGAIPQKETQLISTLQYFVRLINLVTNFFDTGMVNTIPREKAEAIKGFNGTIYTLSCRKDQLVRMTNKAPIGGKVTVENLYLGLFAEIKSEHVRPGMKTRMVKGQLYKVEVEKAPVIDWINGRVKDVNGMRVSIRQREMGHLIEELKGILMESIVDVLKDE